jgi:hypothetical protein
MDQSRCKYWIRSKRSLTKVTQRSPHFQMHRLSRVTRRSEALRGGERDTGGVVISTVAMLVRHMIDSSTETLSRSCGAVGCSF